MLAVFTTIGVMYIINAIVCDVIAARERKRIRKENNKRFGIE